MMNTASARRRNEPSIPPTMPPIAPEDMPCVSSEPSESFGDEGLIEDGSLLLHRI